MLFHHYGSEQRAKNKWQDSASQIASVSHNLVPVICPLKNLLQQSK